MKIFPAIVLAAGLMAARATADADDWPRFRGPNGAGISDAATVPTTWTDADYNWKVKLPGGGQSSPVVIGQRLFVTGGEHATAKRMILCLDTATGRTLWQCDYPSKAYQQNNDNSYATSTPAADATGVVVTWTTPAEVLVVALDNAGREIWRRGLGPFVCNHGSGSSPIIVGDLVVLTNDQDDPQATPQNYNKPNSPKTAGKSCVIALDRQTGQTRWQLDRRSSQAAFATPCVRRLVSGAQEIILANTANGLTGVDAATGKINWATEKGFVKRCVGSPVCDAGLVITTAGSGGMGAELFAVRPGAQPALAYTLTKPLPYVPTPIIVGDKLFLWGDDGAISCLRAATGEAIWRGKVEGAFYTSPLYIHDRIFCVTKTGDVVVLGAGDKFELLGRVALGEKCHATPAVAHGVLYLRTFTQLFSLGGKRP